MGNRAAKSRVDRALSVAGGLVQKVISFAWDSNYICTTKQYNNSLQEEILSDLDRPIITNCSFHNPHNYQLCCLDPIWGQKLKNSLFTGRIQEEIHNLMISMVTILN